MGYAILPQPLSLDRGLGVTTADAIAFLTGAVEELGAHEAARLLADVKRLEGLCMARALMEGSDRAVGDELLTAEQAAQRLGMAASTVRRMAQRGEIGSVRAGDAVRFRVEHVEEWIRSHEKKAFSRIDPDYSPRGKGRRAD